MKRDNTAFMESGFKGSLATINMAAEGVAGNGKDSYMREWGGDIVLYAIRSNFYTFSTYRGEKYI